MIYIKTKNSLSSLLLGLAYVHIYLMEFSFGPVKWSLKNVLLCLTL